MDDVTVPTGSPSHDTRQHDRLALVRAWPPKMSPRTRLDGVVLGRPADVELAWTARIALSPLSDAARSEFLRSRPLPRWTSRQLLRVRLPMIPEGTALHDKLQRRLQRLDSRLEDLPVELVHQVLDVVDAADESTVGLRSLLRTCRRIRAVGRERGFAALLERAASTRAGDYLDALAELDRHDTWPDARTMTADKRLHDSSERSRGLSAVIRHMGAHPRTTAQNWPSIQAIASRLTGSAPASLPEAQRVPLVEQFVDIIVARPDDALRVALMLGKQCGMTFSGTVQTRILTRAVDDLVPPREPDLDRSLDPIGHALFHLNSLSKRWFPTILVEAIRDVLAAVASRAFSDAEVDVGAITRVLVWALPERPRVPDARNITPAARMRMMLSGDGPSSAEQNVRAWDAAACGIARRVADHRDALDTATLERIDRLAAERDMRFDVLTP